MKGSTMFVLGLIVLVWITCLWAINSNHQRQDAEALADAYAQEPPPGAVRQAAKDKDAALLKALQENATLTAENTTLRAELEEEP